jgi:hypothetical protein
MRAWGICGAALGRGRSWWLGMLLVLLLGRGVEGERWRGCGIIYCVMNLRLFKFKVVIMEAHIRSVLNKQIPYCNQPIWKKTWMEEQAVMAKVTRSSFDNFV